MTSQPLKHPESPLRETLMGTLIAWSFLNQIDFEHKDYGFRVDVNSSWLEIYLSRYEKKTFFCDLFIDGSSVITTVAHSGNDLLALLNRLLPGEGREGRP